MSHFAQIENNKVTQVIVAHSQAWCEETLGGEWIQTSYNTHGNQHPENRPLHKNYAGIGYSWDGTGFAPPQCHEEATLDNETYLWDCTNEDHQPKEIVNE